MVLFGLSTVLSTVYWILESTGLGSGNSRTQKLRTHQAGANNCDERRLGDGKEADDDDDGDDDDVVRRPQMAWKRQLVLLALLLLLLLLLLRSFAPKPVDDCFVGHVHIRCRRSQPASTKQHSLCWLV